MFVNPEALVVVCDFHFSFQTLRCNLLLFMKFELWVVVLINNRPLRPVDQLIVAWFNLDPPALLHRELIAQMDPTWIGVHALMQDPDVKATVTTMWDKYAAPGGGG